MPVRRRLGARGVALGELVAQVGEGRGGAGAEGDRLLDLEVERHAVVVDAAVVLDRHEREEAQQLLRAAGGLVGREGRGGEALERRDRPLGARVAAAARSANAARACSVAAAPRSSS